MSFPSEEKNADPKSKNVNNDTLDSEAMSELQPLTYRPDLPDWGVFLHWPHEGDEWIHEADRSLASEVLPSPRVWRRTEWDGRYYWLRYGNLTLRVKPSMWTQAPECDLDVGQQVEVLANRGENDPGIFRVKEIYFSRTSHECEFWLAREELVLEKVFRREDLKPTYVRYELRSGVYQHELPKSLPPKDLETLDVGDLESPVSNES
ncbi:MAG: hypothetical protein AB8B50_04690 [Pirellulaceae bacterium]